MKTTHATALRRNGLSQKNVASSRAKRLNRVRIKTVAYLYALAEALRAQRCCGFHVFSLRALRLCEREYDIEFLIMSTEHNENDSRNGATAQRIIAKNVAAWRRRERKG